MKILRTLGMRGLPIISFMMPLLAAAQGPIAAPASPVTSFQSLLCLIDRIVNAFFWVLIAISIIYILIAAFKYLTAGGAEEKIKEANHALIYAGIAIVVAIIAKGIPFLIFSITNTGTIRSIVC